MEKLETASKPLARARAATNETWAPLPLPTPSRAREFKVLVWLISSRSPASIKREKLTSFRAIFSSSRNSIGNYYTNLKRDLEP